MGKNSEIFIPNKHNILGYLYILYPIEHANQWEIDNLYLE